jgi:hypothetical protein
LALHHCAALKIRLKWHFLTHSRLMKRKTNISNTALLGLLSLFISTQAAAQFKECAHKTNGVLDGTYAIVPVSQTCPPVPDNWQPTIVVPPESTIKKHDDTNHLCQVVDFPIDL